MDVKSSKSVIAALLWPAEVDMTCYMSLLSQWKRYIHCKRNCSFIKSCYSVPTALCFLPKDGEWCLQLENCCEGAFVMPKIWCYEDRVAHTTHNLWAIIRKKCHKKSHLMDLDIPFLYSMWVRIPLVILTVFSKKCYEKMIVWLSYSFCVLCILVHNSVTHSVLAVLVIFLKLLPVGLSSIQQM